MGILLSFCMYILLIFTFFPSIEAITPNYFFQIDHNEISEVYYENYNWYCNDEDENFLLENLENLKFDEKTFLYSLDLSEIDQDSKIAGLIDKQLMEGENNVDLLKSNFLLLKGTTLNNMLLYQEAISVLTEAITYNPSNKEAYIERATAYFETDKLSFALKDYDCIQKLNFLPIWNPVNLRAELYIPENKIDFSKGLIAGVLSGGKVSTEEFFPSLFSSMRGLLNGLWAFTCSPVEVSQDLISAAYVIGEFINAHSNEECLHCVIPELKELSLSWHKCNDHTRGKKIGFIIGKYGIDIFAPIGALKGLSKITNLKRANTMLTLECCAKSKAKQLKILEESSKHATLRTTIVSEVVKSSKICIKNSNVEYHIMQKKHAWDKIIKLSGNLEEDFKKIIVLLEEHDIMNKIFIHEVPKKFPLNNPKIIRTNYKKFINDHEIFAVFETHIVSGEIYLNDAWVITK